MALSTEIKDASLTALLRHYDNDTWQLTDTERQILTRINQLAAENDIPLSSQSRDLLDTLLRTVKQSSSIENLTAEQAPDVIFGFLLTALGEQSLANQSRHRSQGRFDTTPLYLRAARDQMQDHDMTLLMPKSTDRISVMAVLNTNDNSAAAIQDNLASEIFDEHIRHIIIPIGPGHWRGVYLTKHDGLFDLELFDPYGGTGARAIESFILRLLESCGLSEDLLQIRYSGPVHPQGDAYSCGDFTCAYSHKKMKEFGATAEQYNENLIATLDSLGNKDNVLRLATREEIRKLSEPSVSIAEPEASIRPIPVPVPVIVQEPVSLPVPEPVKVNVSDMPAASEESNPVTPEPVVSKPQSATTNAPSTGLTIGTATIIGAFAGAIAGFVILPAVAIVTLAVVIGAGIGALLGLAVNALSMLFASPKVSIPENKVQATPVNPTSAAEASLRSVVQPEQEPIISGPLFAPVPARGTGEEHEEDPGIALRRS
ncbi:DUF456 domain-containing protein [Legionella shakespearei]|uniref:Substrate of the Dot/Icm secretion system n=1 Tax=Legionella shakespearei DSM 23087 TaxID=1122169 RepID=A0A0W0YQK7_9GAMM|nr:DUF456 domain-containing protein [Legionella shakespearei]KTD59147.1 substrate of the Dot/Icm secretion system [Legionella shakespearei DSM 23087]